MESNSIVLNNEDFDKLVELLENPPAPNQKLIDAFKKYRDKFPLKVICDDLIE